MAESLLPDTDAIPKSTIEFVKYRGKWLVRYKDRDGSVHRKHTADFDEASAAYMKWTAEMKDAAQSARRNSGW